MRRFIKRAIFVAAAASAVVAYLKKKSEEEKTEYIEIKDGNNEDISLPEAEPEKKGQAADDEIEELLKEIGDGISELDSEIKETVEEVIPEIKERGESIESLLEEINSNETVEEKAEEEVEKIEEIAEAVEEKVDEAVEEVAQNVEEGADKAAEVAEELKEEITEEVQEVEEKVEEAVEEIKVEEPVVDVIADAEPIEIIENTSEDASIDSILNDILDAKEEVSEAEKDAIEVVEPIMDVEVPSDILPHDPDEIIDEVFEPVQPVETTVKDIIEEPKPFPHLSENKIKSIKAQINAMLAAVGECRELELEHRAVFNNYNDYESYKTVADGLGYEMDDIDEHNEVRLTNTVVATESQLNHSVLTLADSLSAYRGNYKGWGVKDIID